MRNRCALSTLAANIAENRSTVNPTSIRRTSLTILAEQRRLRVVVQFYFGKRSTSAMQVHLAHQPAVRERGVAESGIDLYSVSPRFRIVNAHPPPLAVRMHRATYAGAPRQLTPWEPTSEPFEAIPARPSHIDERVAVDFPRKAAGLDPDGLIAGDSDPLFDLYAARNALAKVEPEESTGLQFDRGDLVLSGALAHCLSYLAVVLFYKQGDGCVVLPCAVLPVEQVGSDIPPFPTL